MLRCIRICTKLRLVQRSIVVPPVPCPKGKHSMSTTGQGMSSLWKTEDWWAVWIGFGVLTFAVVMAGFETGVKAPKIPGWRATSGNWSTK